MNDNEKDQSYKELRNKLLRNRITIRELQILRENVDADDLAYIIQHIYDLNEEKIFSFSMVEGMLKKLDDVKNSNRNDLFIKKIKKGFRKLDGVNRKIILAEGDSWFNYPLILTDIVDTISMDEDMAVYSIAKGGDWLLNMLNSRKYIEELSVVHPDYFLISGGGNDIVGAYRVAAYVTTDTKDPEYNYCPFAEDLIAIANNKYVPLKKQDFEFGRQYLSKDFFALLMFFHLQYYFLINGILNGGHDKDSKGKFPGIKIITQGYDFPVPSYKKDFGPYITKWYVPFIRMFLGHGRWLKTPMQMRGINDTATQQKILYAMIYLFNEMMIYTGGLFNEPDNKNVYHIDSRGSIPENGWTDELHPKPIHFMKTGKVFIHCIRQDLKPTYNHVYVVNSIK